MKEAAKEIKTIFDNFIEVGFSQEQALDLTRAIVIAYYQEK